MASGRGTLELAYFQFEVLEQYRNDPRFFFRFGDFGADTTTSDQTFLDAGEPEHDKVAMAHIGFAYDLSGYDANDVESPIVRRVCAFYGDLAKLSPTHQQRWKTYEVAPTLQPHPVWWAQQMGHWPDGLGPFERLFYELENLNALFAAAFGQDLFRSTDRPDDFGWILRPAQRDWDDFVHTFDKVLSDNMRHDGLTAAGAPRQDATGQNLGTIVRLGRLLEAHGISEADSKFVLQPIREVRQARQAPAHALRQNVTDRTLVHKQIALLGQVNRMLTSLREFFQSHPANRGWTEPQGMAGITNYRM